MDSRFELPPKKKVKSGKGSKPRMSIGFYKNTDDTTENDILNLCKNDKLSEADILYKYFKTESPSDIKRILLYTAIKDLGLLKE